MGRLRRYGFIVNPQSFNDRLVACAQLCAEAYRGRHAVISRDPRYDEKSKELLTHSARLDAMATRWEAIPLQTSV